MNIRKKGTWKTGESKFVIEDKGKYVETLPPIQDLLKLLRLEITSCPIKEEKIKIEKKPSKTSHNPQLNECPIQDVKTGTGILRPSVTSEGRAYEGVTWECDRCDFKTGLLFEDKRCPKCNKTTEKPIAHEEIERYKQNADKIMKEILTPSKGETQ